MSRRLTDMRWDEKGNPANLQAAAADALLWLDRMEKLTREKRKMDKHDLPALIAAREQLEKYLGVDARTKNMPDPTTASERDDKTIDIFSGAEE